MSNGVLIPGPVGQAGLAGWQGGLAGWAGRAGGLAGQSFKQPVVVVVNWTYISPPVSATWRNKVSWPVPQDNSIGKLAFWMLNFELLDQIKFGLFQKEFIFSNPITHTHSVSWACS